MTTTPAPSAPSRLRRAHASRARRGATVLDGSRRARAVTNLPVVLVVLVVVVVLSAACQAPASTPTDGATITVTSVLDVVADDGACTLREAILVANGPAGAPGSGTASGECPGGLHRDTIAFGLGGRADFVNQGRPGFTIRPLSPLPPLTDPVIIDGFTQPGSRPNSTRSPLPLDTVLLVHLDGTRAGATGDGLVLAPGSAGTTIRGLSIGGFGSPGLGTGVVIDAEGVGVQGVYIGTDPTGMHAVGNGFAGFTTRSVDGRNAVIGGSLPAERNLISGNGTSAGYPATGATIRGNYIGTDATGAAPLPNGTVLPAGALSIDGAADVTVGGVNPGDANVISGNASHGIAPEVSPRLRVSGNLIGTDWTGRLPVPNLIGIAIAGDQTGSVLGGASAGAGNIISGNVLAGLIDGSTGRLSVIGNTIGLAQDGRTPMGNAIGIATRSDLVLGGPGGGRNVVSGNASVNVLVRGVGSTAGGAVIGGNLIGTDAAGEIRADISSSQGAGITVEGDVADTTIGGVPNRIAGNRGWGVAIACYESTALGSRGVPVRIAVTGNEIFGNAPDPAIPGSTGAGIDHLAIRDDSPEFHPLTGQDESFTGLGPDGWSDGDVEEGPDRPNEGVAPPTVSLQRRDGSVIATVRPAGNATVGTTYRVDLYRADPGGPGEAVADLGHAFVVATGDPVTVEIPVAGDPEVLTATATRLTGASGTPGSTSEFTGWITGLAAERPA